MGALLEEEACDESGDWEKCVRGATELRHVWTDRGVMYVSVCTKKKCGVYKENALISRGWCTLDATHAQKGAVVCAKRKPIMR